MGSTMKRSIFDEQTSKALKQWHKKALKKKNEGKQEQTATRTLGRSPDDSPVQSPSHARPRSKKSSPELSDIEADALTPQRTANIMATVDLNGNQQRPNNNQHDLLS